jgi:hypothetical protein
MRLIKSIFTAYPELLPDDFVAWLEIPRVFVGMTFTGSLFTRSTYELGDQLAGIVDRCTEGIVIGQCFQAISILVHRETPVRAGFVQQFVAAGWRAIDGRLTCQKSQEFDAESSQSIGRFL